MSWLRVDKQHPCPVCEKKDWCFISDDSNSALCMRVPSAKTFLLKSGETGYIHFLDKVPIKRPVVKPFKPIVILDANRLFNEAYSKTKMEEIKWLACDLGVTEESLLAGSGVGAAWFKEDGAWGFPMRDGNYQTIGIRLRDQSGRKWAVKGSKSGLFYCLDIPPARVVICEGPTDTAAALSCGLFAIGRPSCSSGVHEIIQFIRKSDTIREVVIIADNDDPGLNGARALASMLPVRCCVCTLPCKDMREFYKAGGSELILTSLVNNMRWTMPGAR